LPRTLKLVLTRDGQAVDQNQLQIAKTVCRGDVQSAAQGRKVDTSNFITGPNCEDLTIYKSCVAQYGYAAAQ